MQKQKINSIDAIQTPSELKPVTTTSEEKDGIKKVKCQTLANLVNSLYEAKTEIDVKASIRQIDQYLKLSDLHYQQSDKNPANDPDHDDCLLEQINQAKKALESTYRVLPKFKLSQFEVMKVTVVRSEFEPISKPKKDGSTNKLVKKQETTYILTTTSKRGTWRAMYGFSLISTHFLYKDEQYFLQANTIPEATTTIPASGNEPERTETQPARTEYKITKENDPRYFNLVPAIYFTWIDYKQLRNKWLHSWTGGLGFDLQAPVIYLGHQVTYQQVLCLNYGISLVQQSRLNGRYKPGQVLQENLTADQLHTNPYRPQLYLGISFRFNENPIPTGTGGSR